MAPKRKTTGLPASPKRKKPALKEKEKEEAIFTVEKVEKLSEEIQKESKYNNIVTLLDQLSKVGRSLVDSQDPSLETLGRSVALALFKTFQVLFKDGKLQPSAKKQDENERIVAKWLLDKYRVFKTTIGEILKSSLPHGKSLQLDLFDINLKLVRVEAENSKERQFPIGTYRLLLETLLDNENGTVLPDGLSSNFLVLEYATVFEKYWDLEFYFFNALGEALEQWKQSLSPQRLAIILSNYITIIRNGLLYAKEDLEKQPTWITSTRLPSSLYKQTQFKAQFQKCILTIFSYPLLVSQYKAILLILHKKIIPYMSQPQSLMDFLTDSYDIQDDLVIPILALNSLYELIKDYNIEYPDFYTKLYSLLRPELLYTRYRSRFFRLCDLFLTSTHLSANLVASFIKKLARLSLTSSVSGVVIIIPFIYNLLKRHPTCMLMIHNTNRAEKYQDPFNNLETNPMNTQAINSSLWELETLMSHYHPNVATLAKIFGEPFKKPSYNMEDFLDWTYQSLLETERTRRYRGQAALEFEEFDSVFGGGNTIGNVLLEGWLL
ncbi:uncharacterized protein LODBEIA_P25660 [Lodderomyces beijingensis]|uniref:CCAAT-binding factor domain-containing protein n=1 Tax=Lodderomyces beijingensis TaxID=1775926 RepID=A0ABP0ZQ73_9ASCO